MDLFYRHHRTPGPPKARLISIHGFGEHGGMMNYLWLAEALTRQGIEVWQLDLRGNGKSPGRRGYIDRWETFRKDVRHFVSMVPGDLPRVLCGLSMGGLVVVDYGLHHPDTLDGVVAVVPPLGVVGLSPWLQRLGKILSNLWPGFSVHTGLRASNLSRDQKAVEAYMKDELFSLRGTARLLTELLDTAEAARRKASAWKLPLLLLQGGADPVCPIDEQFPQAVPAPLLTRRIYEGAKHNLYLETNREEVFSDIANWVQLLLGQKLAR